MRILLVSGVYPPNIGGPSAQTQQLAQLLIRRGIETQVVTFGETPATAIIDGVPVTFLDGSLRRGWGDKLLKNWQVYQALCQVIRAFQPTVVHQQTAVANLALYTGLAARRCGVPTVLKYSSDLVWERLHRRPQTDQQQGHGTQWWSRLRLTQQQHFLFSLYDCLWVTTPAFQSRLQQDFRVSPQKIFLLPNFIDLSQFTQIANRKKSGSYSQVSGVQTILTVTRLQPWKGVDFCIQALAKLQDLPIKLRIVGEGDPAYVATLKALVQDLGLGERVEFLGRIPPDQIHGQYAEADVFVLASTYEPFGIVLVEAMAAGVPVVASRVDGIPAVMEDCGVLVPPQDVPALALALRRVLQEPQTHETLGLQGRRRAEVFGLDQGCDRMIDLYKKLA